MMIPAEVIGYVALGLTSLWVAYSWGYASGSMEIRMKYTGETVEQAIRNELKEKGH